MFDIENTSVHRDHDDYFSLTEIKKGKGKIRIIRFQYFYVIFFIYIQVTIKGDGRKEKKVPFGLSH